jgi:ADP-heptose:LPS heptosyltransferase
LGKALKVKIVVIGTREEREIVENVINQGTDAKPGISNILMAIGWPLDGIVALIERADLFVGNNSGPLHIAWGVGTPTVSTMGPTDPDLWWPVGENHTVIRKGLPCSPCNRPICKSHDCMRLITVEDMMEAVEVQLKKISRAKCEPR